jgi:N-acyl-L-homoserine lactone synthetase
MIELRSWSRETAGQLIDLRARAFRKSGRDQSYIGTWLTDLYDERAHHVVVTDDHRQVMAAVRLVFDGRWPLEDTFPQICAHKQSGVEFGRLVVERMFHAKRRVLFDLIAAASQYCTGLGRADLYGLVIVPFRRYLERQNVPVEVISTPLQSYGESANAVRFDARELIRHYRIRTGEEAVQI